jgi:hypothetical protein
MQEGPKQKNGQKAPLSIGAIGNMPALLCRELPSAFPGETSRRKGGAPDSFPIYWYRKRIAAVYESLITGISTVPNHQYLGEELRGKRRRRQDIAGWEWLRNERQSLI